jgi:hypothetical protein
MPITITSIVNSAEIVSSTRRKRISAGACLALIPAAVRFLRRDMNGSSPKEHGWVEIVDLDGKHRTILTMPSETVADIPEWT